MSVFPGDDFLLETEVARDLYHRVAKDLPVVDYHCHLSAERMAADHRFRSITEVWLDGDHYKWRAMRTAGVPERLCSGDAPDREKFEAWAATVPQTLGNPLHHWTHMELRRPFGILLPLSPATAGAVYEAANARLAEAGFTAMGLLEQFKVAVVCTTDDPTDSLEPHARLARREEPATRVYPTWRPDRALFVEDLPAWTAWLEKLEAAAGAAIGTWDEMLCALETRHAFFHERGCRASDRGLERVDSEPFTDGGARRIFDRLRAGREVEPTAARVFRSALLHRLALLDHERGWVQQLHLGAMRNTNTRMRRLLGPDTGFDSIGDLAQARPLARFLDRLDEEDRLARTILYNLNPADNALFATMIGNFQDGRVPGKMQWGSAWWFLDQLDGMEAQLRTLATWACCPASSAWSPTRAASSRTRATTTSAACCAACSARTCAGAASPTTGRRFVPSWPTSRSTTPATPSASPSAAPRASTPPRRARRAPARGAPPGYDGRVTPAALLALALLAPAGAADEPPADAAPPVFYETTTVTARPVSSAAGAVSVLDAREVEDGGGRSAGDVLAQVPGLNALASGGRAGVTNAYLRGGDPNHTLVLLDGIPLNDSTELQGGAVNLEELPATVIDHAEVVRGPLASFYGTTALAGVVQLFAPRGGPGPLRARLGAEAGNAAARRGLARVSGPAGRGGWAAGASWDEEEYRVARDRFRQLDLFATADLPLGPAADLALTARVADGSTDDYPEASGGPVYGTGLTRRTDHRGLALGARLALGEPAGRRHLVSLSLTRRDQDRLSPPVPPVVPAAEEATAFTRLRVAWQAPLVRTARTVVEAGASAEGEWGENESVLKLPPLLGGDVPGDYSESRASGGVYAGARHERGAFLYEASLRLDRAGGDALQANPHAGLVWRPGRGPTRVRASVGRASRLPSFFALASPPALGGNPALEPERVWGGEAGVERRVEAARLDVGAAYFLKRYDDLVDFDFERFLHVNRARVRSQGVELTARWQPHPTVRLDGQATWLDVLDLETGGPLLHVPRWAGGARLTWEPDPRLSLRLHARTTEGYLDRQYPVPERDSVDGYSLLGAAASWRPGRGLVVRLRAENLAGRAYETFVGFPGPGRSLWAGLGWER
jgi:glucuronate isomerase